MTQTVQTHTPNTSPTAIPPMAKPKRPEVGEKLRGHDKVARIPVKIIPTVEAPKKPDWIRVKTCQSVRSRPNSKTPCVAKNSTPSAKKRLVRTCQNAGAMARQPL